jgi:hypothetical protein
MGHQFPAMREKIIVHTISSHQNDFSWCPQISCDERNLMVVFRALMLLVKTYLSQENQN